MRNERSLRPASDDGGDGPLPQALSGAQRLNLLKALRLAPVTESRCAVAIKDAPNLRQLYGGDVFDGISVRIQEDKAKERIHVSFEFLRWGKVLPRIFGCTLEKDGSPHSILETFFNDSSPEPANGIEGSCVFIGLKDEKSNPEDARQAANMLSRFDQLLLLASRSRGQQMTLN